MRMIKPLTKTKILIRLVIHKTIYKSTIRTRMRTRQVPKVKRAEYLQPEVKTTMVAMEATRQSQIEIKP